MRRRTVLQFFRPDQIEPVIRSRKLRRGRLTHTAAQVFAGKGALRHRPRAPVIANDPHITIQEGIRILLPGGKQFSVMVGEAG